MTPKQVLAASRTLLTTSTWEQTNYDGLHPARIHTSGKLDILRAVWGASGSNPDDANAAIDALKPWLTTSVKSLSLLNDTTTLTQLRALLQQAAA